MPGPPPKPSGMRQRHAQRSGIEVVRDQPGAIIPEPPKGLLKVARERWEAYWRSPVAQAVDLGADLHRLTRWISAVDEWHRVSKALRRQRVVPGSMGQPVLNPLAGYLATIEATIAKAEAEFGMTPMARLKLGIAIGQARLTAADLNKALEAHDDDDSSGALEAEWEEA